MRRWSWRRRRHSCTLPPRLSMAAHWQPGFDGGEDLGIKHSPSSRLIPFTNVYFQYLGRIKHQDVPALAAKNMEVVVCGCSSACSARQQWILLRLEMANSVKTSFPNTEYSVHPNCCI
ncbi:uncharacterized protein LOC124700147 [Lolium rigidum]|uniref:uncharacterized protein LOC124700147 n=1 Tax=Lolium rigidum TaxID=89674 RepID=UPI001F5DE5AF|nr:uncharacterized protein LOC124700147 [Lolium rigidum]